MDFVPLPYPEIDPVYPLVITTVLCIMLMKFVRIVLTDPGTYGLTFWLLHVGCDHLRGS